MSPVARSHKQRLEWWLLAAAIALSALMLVAPAAIPVGIGLLAWAAVLLGRKKPAQRAALVVAIVALGSSLAAVAVIGLSALMTFSTDTGSVTLIEG